MKYFLILIILCSTDSLNAQLKGFSIGPYAEMGWPAGNSKTRFSRGYAAGLNADIKFGKIGISGAAGYTHFSGVTQPGNVKYPDLAGFPILAGLKFHPIPIIYFSAQAGSAKLTKDRGSAFILSPGIGARFLGLDLLAKYETWRKAPGLQFFALRASYNF